MSNALKFLLELDASQAKAALASFQSSLQTTLRNASNAGAAGNPLAGIQAGAASAVSSIGGLAASMLSLKAVSVAAAGAFAKSAIEASEGAENAFRGLESIANRTGVGISKAWGAVQQLTADGLMSQTEAATALKNLFSRGFGLEEAVALINRFKDSAAFGRQAALGFGEAVVGATEGLKNENSALVDNAGVTKNVAKMWEDYAKEIGVTAGELTQAQKRQAEYNGVMKETEAQVGDSKKLQEGLSGANAKLGKSFNDLKTTLGDELKPAYTDLIKLTTTLLDKTNEYLKTSKEAMKPQALVSNNGIVGAIARGTRSMAGAVGFALPPVPPQTAAIPPLSTNTTGIKVVAPGPGGRPIVDNIDKAAVERRAQEEADIKAKAEAKQALTLSEKRLKREAADSRNALDIYRSGLDAQKAVLEKNLAEGAITRAEFSKKTADLETQELLKAEELRSARIVELRKQVELAAKTGNAEVLADAQQALRDEEAQAAAAANKIKAARTKVSTESVADARQGAEERRRIEEQLLSARIDAERTAGEAIRDKEIALVEGKVAARVLTEEEGVRQVAALRDAELVAEIDRITRLRAFYAEQSDLTPAQAASATAQREKLLAQATALEAKRVQVAAEADAKIAESARELAELRVELEQDLLDAQGRTFDAQSAQIDAWLEEKRKQLAGFPELLAKAEAVASARQKNVSFERVQEGVQGDNSRFDRDRAELDRRSKAGLVTDIDYDRESLALKKQQADALRERLALLQENSNGSSSAVAAIADLEAQIAELDAAMSSTAESINENFFNSVEKGFQDLLSGAKKPLEALRDIAVSVLRQIADMALRYSLQKAFAGFGGGGGLGGAVMSLFGGFRAAGGAVSDDRAYITGEKGPELFFPGSAGTVVSSSRIEQVLAGMLTGKTLSPAAYFNVNQQAAAGAGPTNVSVSPKVVIAAGDLFNALRNEPGFNQHIVQVAASNGKRIQAGW